MLAKACTKIEVLSLFFIWGDEALLGLSLVGSSHCEAAHLRGFKLSLPGAAQALRAGNAVSSGRPGPWRGGRFHRGLKPIYGASVLVGRRRWSCQCLSQRMPPAESLVCKRCVVSRRGVYTPPQNCSVGAHFGCLWTGRKIGSIPQFLCRARFIWKLSSIPQT